MNRTWAALLTGSLLLLAACEDRSRPPLLTAEQEDLQRFMGPWHVIASIPTRLERGAHNAVESYRLNADGTVATTFTFNAGSDDGPLKTYHPLGFVLDRRSNAVWGMRFVWPIKAEYRIMYVDPDYTQTIIGRTARDYVWIMARAPQLSPADYAHLSALIAAQGYDPAALQRVPPRAAATAVAAP
jgi:apolipoprotein D and lipocalin family protein